MNRTIRMALTGAATLLSLGLAGCTDPSVAPSSTIPADRHLQG